MFPPPIPGPLGTATASTRTSALPRECVDHPVEPREPGLLHGHDFGHVVRQPELLERGSVDGEHDDRPSAHPAATHFAAALEPTASCRRESGLADLVDAGGATTVHEVTIYLIVGLPGAGKTTRAKELEVSESALRLTPDDWQMAVFHADSPSTWRTEERADHRERIEGKLLEIGLRAAGLGLDVVLDFGFWGRDERSALRWMAASLGVRAEVVHLPVSYEEQRRRIAGRSRAEPGHFEMSDVELQQWQRQFEAPDEDEVLGRRIPPVPPGHVTWSQWASERWPSLPEQQVEECATDGVESDRPRT